MLAADVDTNLGQFEPNIVVNPADPSNVIVAQFNQLAISTDYGRNFPTTITAQVPAGLPAGYGFGGDPSMAFDSSGRLFWTYLVSLDVDGDGNRELADGDDLSVAVQEVNPRTGALIGNAVDVTPGAHSDDKQWIAVDSNAASPYADNIYLVWTRLDGPDTVMFSRSVNGGAVFSAPSDVSGVNGGNGFVWPSHVAVGRNGDLYVGWHNDTNGSVNATVSILRDSTGGLNLQNGTPVQSATFQAAVSTNVQDTGNAIPQTDFWAQGASQPYILPDPVRPGNVYVVVNDDPDDSFNTFAPPSTRDSGDVYIFRSTNFGQTFSGPIRVDSGPAGTFQTMPNAAIDELGNIAVTWYDTRGGSVNAGGNLLLDLYAATSRDGGLTWSPDFRINDVPFDPDLNAPTRFDGPPVTTRIGEYNGIAAASGTTFLAWTGNDGTQEVFFDAFNTLAPFNDEYEPNDTLATATVLGSLPEITLRGALADGSDRDNFRYTAHSTGKVVANLYFNAVVANLELRVRDESGDLIASALQSNVGAGTDVESLSIPVVSGRRYVYEVFSNDVIVNPAEYTLELENFAVPVPTEVDLLASSDSGTSNADDVTRDRLPIIDVFSASLANFIAGVTPNTLLTAAAATAGNTGFGMLLAVVNQQTGALQQFFADPVGASGTLWRWTPAAAIAPGTYLISAAGVVIDGETPTVLGTGGHSEPLLLVVDTTPPAGPVPDLLASSDSGRSSTDNITRITSPAFQGDNVEPNSQVFVFGNGVLIGTGRVGTDGHWEVTVEPLDDGQYDITAVYEDLAGNRSTATNPLAITIDTAVPNTPYLDLTSDSGRSDVDDVTNVGRPVVTVTADDTLNGGPNPAPNRIAYRIYDRPGGAAANGEVLLVDSFAALGGFSADGFFTHTLSQLLNSAAGAPLADGVHNFKLEVEDEAGNLSPDFLLTVVIDTVAPPSPTIVLDPAVTDTGIASNQATYLDRITRTTVPGFVGTAEADAIVRLFGDGPVVSDAVLNASDVPIGLTVAIPLDGNHAFPNGQYRLTSIVDLNNTVVGFPRDGQRQIGGTAEDLAGNVSAASFIDIQIDTTPPVVSRVDLINGLSVFGAKPTLAPTPPVNSLLIQFSGGPPAGGGPSSPAVDAGLATNVANYQLVGDHNGNILITGATIVSTTPEQTVVRIDFAEPLPDDRFTLLIKDAVSDAAGNLLDGSSQAQSPGLPGQVLPSGNGIPGGNFVARFTVDSRPEIGAVSEGLVYVDINGNLEWDPTGKDNDATNRDFVFQFGQIVDAHFAGNFSATGALVASGFDKLGAYGKFGNSYSFLLDTDDNGVGDFSSPMPASYQVNGIPVAGNFSAAHPGDEIGLFDGSNWYLDTNGNNRIDVGERWASNFNGLPLAGDFNGDGADDLAAYNNATNVFVFDTNRDGVGDYTWNVQDTVKRFTGLSGFTDRPVAGDLNLDGVDDIGLWITDRAGTLPRNSGEYFFWVSDQRAANPAAVFDAYSPAPLGNDLFAEFGDDFALPIFGNFDPPVTNSPSTENPLHRDSNPYDTNGDGFVSAIDALLVINVLNQNLNLPANDPVRAFATVGYQTVDVSGDRAVTALDALLVINALNQPADSQAEGEQPASAQHADSVDAVFAQIDSWELDALKRKRLGA